MLTSRLLDEGYAHGLESSDDDVFHFLLPECLPVGTKRPPHATFAYSGISFTLDVYIGSVLLSIEDELLRCLQLVDLSVEAFARFMGKSFLLGGQLLQLLQRTCGAH